MAPRAILRVTGKRNPSSEATEVCGLKIELPRLPWSTWLSHSRYCFQNGWLRWSCWRILAISPRLALVPPAMATAGSPGRRNTRLKTAKEISSSSGMVMKRRLTMNDEGATPTGRHRGLSAHFLM